jgi:hypothetical protein
LTTIADKLRQAGIKVEKLTGNMTKNETAPTKENGSFILNSGTKNSKRVEING